MTWEILMIATRAIGCGIAMLILASAAEGTLNQPLYSRTVLAFWCVLAGVAALAMLWFAGDLAISIIRTAVQS